MKDLSFDNEVLFVIDIFKDTSYHQEIWITQTIFNTWLIMIFLFIISLIVKSKLTKFNQKPTGFQNAVEALVEKFAGFSESIMGERYSYIGNWFFGVIIFIACTNLSGLVGLRPATTSLATTAALALATFVLIHFFGIYTAKGEYFKEYFKPFPFMFPIHLIGEVATPLSLSFRLFGNILGGYIVMSMLYKALGSASMALTVLIPAPFNFYFDVFAGGLQAFIFTILSMTFIKNKIAD